jgi:hypothetical protein
MEATKGSHNGTRKKDRIASPRHLCSVQRLSSEQRLPNSFARPDLAPVARKSFHEHIGPFPLQTYLTMASYP